MDLSRIYDGFIHKLRFAGIRRLQSWSSRGDLYLGGARVLTLLINVALHSGVRFGQVFSNTIHL
jgi:hypothetical protein